MATLLERDRHIPDGNFHDEEALIKKVIDLKAQQVDLRQRQTVLKSQEEMLELSSSSLKQEYNIIAVAADIHGWKDLLLDNSSAGGGGAVDAKPVDDDDGGGGENIAPNTAPASSSSSAEDKKFSTWNRKLELQVLNEEIRACCPRLEAEALALEADIFAIERAALIATEAQKHLPALLNKTAAELEEEMGLVIERRIQVKAQIRRETEALTAQKTAIVKKVSSLREQLALAASERDMLLATSQELDRGKKNEEARLRVLRQRLADVRAAFDPVHGAQGWAVEAWIHAHEIAAHAENSSGSGSGMGLDAAAYSPLRVDALPAALEQWCCNPRTDGPFTAADVRRELLEVNGGGATIDFRKFVYLCSRLAQ